MDYLKNKNYWFGSGYMFFFFATWSLWWSFYAIWLKGTINLSGEQIGIVYSINSAVSMLFMFVYGIIQDQLQVRKHLATFIGILMVFIGPFLIYVYEPLLKDNFYLGVIVGAPALSAAFISACGLLESFVEKISRKFDFEYGPARFWGSLGYAMSTFIAGMVFSINPHINFWLSSAVAVIFLINNFAFNPNDTKNMKMEDKAIDAENKNTSVPKLSDVILLLKLPRFWALVCFIFGTFSFYQIYDQQLFPNFYVSLFSTPEQGNLIYGYLNSFQVFLESAAMLVIPFLVNKIGSKKAIILAGLVMTVRIACSGLFDDVYMISLVKLLHSVEIPLFVLSMFKYIVSNFDERLSSTIYLLALQIAQQIGVIVISEPVGHFFDKNGYHTTFFVLATIVFVITMISSFTLSDKKEIK